MGKFNPNIHHRRSIRLKGYDYSQAGLYFVTICTQNRECLFGEIVGADLGACPKMILNAAGIMIRKWYYELENKFSDIKCDAMIIMPNHFHCIIENVGNHVGADLRVCPKSNINEQHKIGERTINGEQRILDEQTILGEHIGSPLHRVVQWFKTMSTNEYIRNVKNNNWKRFDGKLWQRNYWEHIIRNEKSYNTIAEYIKNNPDNWDKDKLFK